MKISFLMRTNFQAERYRKRPSTKRLLGMRSKGFKNNWKYKKKLRNFKYP